jgi:hypothetical protein
MYEPKSSPSLCKKNVESTKRKRVLNGTKTPIQKPAIKEKICQPQENTKDVVPVGLKHLH